MKKLLMFLVALGLIMSVSHHVIKAQEEVLWEGFEGDLKWSAVDWENVGQVDLSIDQEQVSEGSNSLKVDMKEEAIDWKNKVAFSKEDYLNLDGLDNMVLDAYCPYPFGLTVGVAFDTGNDWAYYELASKPLKKGWNKDITFDLTKNNFKCQASDWKHSKALADKDDVRKVHILVYRPSKMELQTVYIDNIRFK